MGQNFLPDTVDQILLFPPSLHDWLPDGHQARFLVDVVSALDLEAIYASYREKDGRGQAAYAPEMMVRVLLYGYATGVYSSRRIQTRTYEDVAFRYLSGDQHPDHATIAEFRKRHLDALSGLFTQALLLCAEAGLVKLGHVSIDGTKIKANASKHKAMSYKRMNETEARLKQEIDALLAAAEKTDTEEDARFGKDRHGDELPAELQRREKRLEKIREAKAALEQAAKEQAEIERAEVEQKLAEREEEEKRTGKKKRGRKPQVPDPEQAKPDDTAQRNFIDPESRIMPDGANKGSFVQVCEPDEPSVQPSPEMIFYQPTPVRHILHLIAATSLAEDDVFVDLGSGLGHVPLLVSMATGARGLGIEVQAAYVAGARACAQSLHLSRVRFLPQDAREADLSSGTVFYLYSPFKGSILTNVLSALRMESTRRSIKICSLGPCTRTVANETWLKATSQPDTGRITVFDSQLAHYR